MQRDYWNKNALTMNFTTSLDVGQFQSMVSKDALVLDVGCGYGRTLADLYGIGYKRLIGVDTSGEMVKRGKSAYPYIDMRFQKGAVIDLPENYVDAVVLFGVLCRTPDTKDLDVLINEIKRVLKPGGCLFVNDFLIGKDLRNSLRYRKFEEKYKHYGTFETDDGLVLRHFSEQELNELLGDFDIVSAVKQKCREMNGGVNISVSIAAKLRQKNSAS